MARVRLFNRDPESFFFGSAVVPRLFFGATLVFPVGYRVTASRGNFQFNGQTVFLSRLKNISGEFGSFALNGQSANFLRNRREASAFGAFSLSGQDAQLARTRIMTAANGAFTLNGQDVNFTRRLLDALPGYYDLNAQLTDLYYNSRIQADHELFVLFGQDLNLYVTTNAESEHGTFNLNGQAAGSLYSRVGVNDVGVYLFDGLPAGLARQSRVSSDFGSYSLNGQEVNLARQYPLVAAHGAFALGGQDANSLYSRIHIAAQGAFSLNGQAANLTEQSRVAADQGAFALNGQAAGTVKAFRMTGDQGSFALNGQAATLTKTTLGPTTLTFVASSTNDASTIAVPGSAQAGDIAILIDGTNNTKSYTDVVPSGWSAIGSLYSTISGSKGSAIRCSRKILVSGDVGATVTGMNETDEYKIILVFRPNAAITTVTLGTVNGEATVGNPVSQTVSASGQPTPLVVIGAAANSSSTDSAFSTASPAFDATVASAFGHLIAGYKIYNSSPANHSIDMNDISDNTLVSFFLRVS